MSFKNDQRWVRACEPSLIYISNENECTNASIRGCTEHFNLLLDFKLKVKDTFAHLI